MPQSLAAINIHAVFSTRERTPFFASPEARTGMHALLASVSNRLDCPVLAVDGTDDHVHILFSLSRKMAPMDWVKELKRVSALEWKTNPNHPQDFAWQNGYGMFSVSASQLDAVQRYIADQEEHHKKQGFQDEFRALLKKHHIEWDETYVWS